VRLLFVDPVPAAQVRCVGGILTNLSCCTRFSGGAIHLPSTAASFGQ
jgi:hypothetical protein